MNIRITWNLQSDLVASTVTRSFLIWVGHRRRIDENVHQPRCHRYVEHVVAVSDGDRLKRSCTSLSQAQMMVSYLSLSHRLEQWIFMISKGRLDLNVSLSAETVFKKCPIKKWRKVKSYPVIMLWRDLFTVDG